MPNTVARFAPLAVLGVGCLLLLKVGTQSRTPLRGGLDTVPYQIAGHTGRDQPVNQEEQRVAGMDTYLMRIYQRDSASGFSLYVGYYEAQTQGKTIHSPKNCLPGAGWEPVESRPLTVALATGSMTVNRYLLEKESSRAIVYYWYQGRGRVSWNEFAVKWELLRDKAAGAKKPWSASWSRSGATRPRPRTRSPRPPRAKSSPLCSDCSLHWLPRANPESSPGGPDSPRRLG
jgi:EpsI family protein